MKITRGEVVLVDYPYSDGTGSKVRPALVVQNDNLNLRITDTILAAINCEVTGKKNVGPWKDDAGLIEFLRTL